MKRILILAKFSWKSISLNWRHSAATILAVVAGFCAVALFDGFILALKDHIRESYINRGMIGHLLIEKIGAKEHLFEDPWFYTIDKDQQEKLKNWLEKDSRVDALNRQLVVSGLISNGKGNAVFFGAGADVDAGVRFRGKKWEWNTFAGKPLHFTTPNSFVMGPGMAQHMDCKFQDHGYLDKDGHYIPQERPLDCANPNFQFSVTTEHAQVNAVQLHPSGLIDMQLREFNDRVVALPLQTAQSLMDTDKITRISVMLKNESEIPYFLADLRPFLATMGMEATEWLDHPVAATSKGGIEILRVFRGLFLSVVALIAAMSVANSMMKSINERVREIGTLRSFGFRKNDIVWLFSLEGLFLGLISCVLGILASILLAYIIGNLGLSFNAGVLSTAIPVRIGFAFFTWAGTALTLSLVTFFAAWSVSLRASRMVIADALRYIA